MGNINVTDMDNIPGRIPGQTRDPFPGDDTGHPTSRENIPSSDILNQRMRRRQIMQQDSRGMNSAIEVSTSNFNTIQV